jgi:hypothetical protein
MMSIRRVVRDVVQRTPFLFNPLWRVYFPLFHGNKLFESRPDADRREIFREIYESNGWNSDQSKSGPGSTIPATATLRRKLPKLLRKLDIKIFLDAPCGDFHWMRTVDLGEVEYIGADIVPDLIDRLHAEYAGPKRRFMKLDIVEDVIPAADLWLCRDVLFHLSEADVLQVLRKVADSDVRYFLTSSHPFVKHNRDVYSGGFRHINLRASPYNLPEPVMEIEDFVVPYAPRVLWLWTREQIRESLGAAAN